MTDGTRRRPLGSARFGRRRFLQLTAAGIGAVAVAPAARPHVAHAQFEELYRLARAEGQLNLQGGGPAAPFLAAARQFMAAFPGVTVNFAPSDRGALDRQLASGNVEVDLVIFQGWQYFDGWKHANALLPFMPAGWDQIPAGYKDPDGTHVGIRVGALGFAYSTDRVPPDKVPETAQDFLDPQLAGLCITTYPQADELALYRYDTIVQKYGWEFVERLLANRPQFLRGHLGVAQEISAGRAGVSFDATLETALAAQAAGAPIATRIPEAEGMPIWAQPSGIFRAAPHPNAARLYLSWLLSPEPQAQLGPGQWSVRADVPPPAGFRPIAEYNVLTGYRDFVLDEERLEELQARYLEAIGPVRGGQVS
ncbi:MAG TPA: extracellular solute-binding protein [Chloroflexota bacterium]|jgi:ABC-type Fe3+ transport system substrate-binding protein